MLNKHLITLAYAILLSFSFSVNADLVNDLNNGNFENAWDPNTSVYVGYIYSPDDLNPGVHWQFNGSSGLTKNNTAWGGSDDDGEQFAFIQGGGSSISQEFGLSGTQAVTLHYDWASRPIASSLSTQQLQISLNGQLLSSATIGTTSWTAETLFLGVLNTGTYTLSFSGLPVDSWGVTVFLDDIALSAADVSLFGSLGGALTLLLIGVNTRRRKSI